MKFARFINHVVAEIVEAVNSEEFAKLFHAQVVGMFAEVLNEVQIGWINHSTGIISPATMADYFIDASGGKHVADTGGDQVLQCAYDNVLVFDSALWRVETDADRQAAIAERRLNAIKHTVRQRIYAVASAETQMNMSGVSAFISSKTAANRSQAEKDHLTAYEASLNWVGAMRANVATLVAAPNLDFTDDANWPVTPPEVVALAAQF